MNLSEKSMKLELFLYDNIFVKNHFFFLRRFLFRFFILLDFYFSISQFNLNINFTLKFDNFNPY